MTLQEAKEAMEKAYSDMLIVCNNDTFYYSYKQEKEAEEAYEKAKAVYEEIKSQQENNR